MRKARSVLAARAKDPTKQEWAGGNQGPILRTARESDSAIVIITLAVWLASQMRWALYISKSGKRETLDGDFHPVFTALRFVRGPVGCMRVLQTASTSELA
jgi:hypothetical protein